LREFVQYRDTMSELNSITTNPERDISFVAPGALMGSGAWALKAHHDMGKALDKTSKWYHDVSTAPLRKPGTAIRDADIAAKLYSEGARDLIKTKFGGIPVPEMFFKAYSSGRKYVPLENFLEYHFGDVLQRPVRRLLEARDSGLPVPGLNDVLSDYMRGRQDRKDRLYRIAYSPGALKSDIDGHVGHYRKFTNLNNSDKFIHRYSLLGDTKDYSEAARPLISQVGEGRTLKSVARELARSSPDDYKLLKEKLRGTSLRLAGRGKGGMGAAHAYADAIFSTIPKYKRGVGIAGASLLGSGVALGLHRLNQLSEGSQTSGGDSYDFFKKKASRDLDEDAVFVGSGAGAAGLGWKSHQLYKRPIDVGFSHSENLKVHGAGHRTPGMALKRIVEEIEAENPHLKIRTSLPVLSEFNTFKDPALYGKKYDYLFDTGLGVNFEENALKSRRQKIAQDFDNYARIGRRSDIRVRPGGWVGYMTDIGKGGAAASSYKGTPQFAGPGRTLANFLSGEKDKYILWGPDRAKEDFTPFEPGNGAKLRKRFEMLEPGPAGKHGFPVMGVEAMDILDDVYSKSKGELYGELLKESFLDDAQRAHVEELASGNKKLLMVTGSARGDNVAWRMEELQKYLDENGLADKYKVGGVLGESYQFDALARKTAQDSRMLSFRGRIPQKWYVGLPAIADRVWGSTGTSAAMETAASPVPASFMESANKKLKEQRKFLRGAEGQALASKYGLPLDAFDNNMKHVDLDNWNPGNKAFMIAHKGGQAVQTPEEFMRAVQADTPESMAEARTKGREFLQMSREARKGLKGNILKMFEKAKARNLRHGRYAALGAGGLLATPFLYSGYKEHARRSQPPGSVAPINSVRPSTSTPSAPGSKRYLGLTGAELALLGGGAGAAGLLGTYLLKRRRNKKKNKDD
jgi:hypothetical protein